MKINNKGFAVSSMLYSILLLFLMLIVGVLAMLGNRKVILDKVKGEIVTDLTQLRSYAFSFDYKDIFLSNTSKVDGFTFDLLSGVKVMDQNGNIVNTEITTTSSPTFDSAVNGNYMITYKASYNGNIVEATRNIQVVDPEINEYIYTGGPQQFDVVTSGLYKTELWGAQGGSIRGTAYNPSGAIRANNVTYNGGKGAYTTGNISLSSGTTLFIYVGGMPTTNITMTSGTRTGGYNGGTAVLDDQETYGAAGGGATDIRLASGNWNDFRSLKSRIMVAAGGGGANFRNEGYGEGNGGEGGTITGINGYEALTTGSYFRDDYENGYQIGLGATQTLGGISESHLLDGTIRNETATGTFGGMDATEAQSGGGGGYYSGASTNGGGASGGSSFISGMNGCNAINQNSTQNSITHSGQSIHYSGYAFINPIMKSGLEEMPMHDGSSTMIGNEGHGFVRITPLILSK